jgi:hypothetical protein
MIYTLFDESYLLHLGIAKATRTRPSQAVTVTGPDRSVEKLGLGINSMDWGDGEDSPSPILDADTRSTSLRIAAGYL